MEIAPPALVSVGALAVTKPQADTVTTPVVPLVVASKRSVISPHQDMEMTPLPDHLVMVEVLDVNKEVILMDLVETATALPAREETPTVAVTISARTIISRWVYVM